MCGIAGYITSEKGEGMLDRRKFVEQGFIVSMLRGTNGTGMFMVDHEILKEPDSDNRAYFLRAPSDAYSFVNQEEFSSWMGFMDDYRAVVCHTRYATIGEHTMENTHPFQEGPITLVHNGTVRMLHKLPIPATAAPDHVTVDSHLVAHNLAKHSPEELTPVLGGEYTFIWHDARDGAIRILRNSGRPLYITKAKDQNTHFFMSEAEMLSFVLGRIKVKTEKILYPTPGVLYTFMPGEDEWTSKVLPAYKPPIYTRPATSIYNGYYDPWWKYDGYSSKPELWKPPSVTEKKSVQQETKILINGNWCQLPEPHGVLLEAQGVDPLLQYRFAPASYIERGGRAIVNGSLETDKEKVGGVIRDVRPNDAARYLSEKWSVRPQGVTYAEKLNEEPEPVILCRLIAHFETNDLLEKDAYYLDDYSEESFEELLTADMTLGPDKTIIELDEYDNLVAHGCAFCSDIITTEDAAKITWVKYGPTYSPICPSCTESYGENLG